MNNYEQLEITAIIEETKHAKTFVLKPLNNWQPAYNEGQFITLVFVTEFGEKRRSYSISSALNEQLSITVKKVDNGEFSRKLLYHTQVGDILSSSGISGLFVLPETIKPHNQFFFLAAGSGVTPCYSIIKKLLQTTENSVVLIYSNKTEEETIYYTQLISLQEKFKERFIVKFLFSNRFSVYESRLSNWLLQQLLKTYLQVKKEEALFYVCGPFDYMQTVTISLLNEGFVLHNIKKENYNSLPRIIKPLPPNTDAHLVTVKLKNELHELVVQYPQTILAAAKEYNVIIPYSCEAGRCGSCAATCISGQVWMAYNEVLLDEEVAKGRILCCQSYPVNGDVVIEI